MNAFKKSSVQLTNRSFMWYAKTLIALSLLTVLCLMESSTGLARPEEQEQAFHPPLTGEKRDFTPRPYEYSEPRPLALPSNEALLTITIKNRSFDIKRLSASVKHRDETKAFAAYEKNDEALFFSGSGGAGRKSKERLVIEDCTFVVDFQEGDFSTWDAKRCAIFVTGYNEVLIRNCVFLVKGRPGEPDRRTMASVGVYDTLKVQIEDCYFEGLTNWMRGHVTIFDSGATTLRRLEVTGTKLGDKYWCGGGLWIANGVGEGKLGSAQELENKIYPSGPLLIEDCYVHDQQGNENTDGIYVQSIHPYLIRNCRVENWGKDGLLDLGFRDSARGTFEGKPLINHGTIGIVENCDFAEGYIKCSVGLGGGLIFRNNTLRNVWLYPYVFDGGSWYALNNKWTDQKSVLLSGRDSQTSGWSAKEGMFINGSKMFFYGNSVEGAPGVLFVSSKAKPSNLKETVVADFNTYNFSKPPKLWGDDQAQNAQYATLDDWRTIGNDRNSIVGAGDAPDRTAASVQLPGGVKMNWQASRGPQKMQTVKTEVRAHGEALSRAWRDEWAQQNRRIEFESLKVIEKSGEFKIEKREWASEGAYLMNDAQNPGDKIAFQLPMEKAGRWHIATRIAGGGTGAIYQLTVNGEQVGQPQDFSKRGSAAHGIVALKSGENIVTYTVTGKAEKARDFRTNFDALELTDAALVEARQAREARAEKQKAAARAERARVEATKIIFNVADLSPQGKTSNGNYPKKGGGHYTLWSAKSATSAIAFDVAVPQEGEYSVSVVTSSQADKGTLRLQISDKTIGEAPLGSQMKFGNAALTAGTHRFTFTRVAPSEGQTKVRFDRIELLPQR